MVDCPWLILEIFLVAILDVKHKGVFKACFSGISPLSLTIQHTPMIYLKYNKSYRIPILAAILDFEHEGVVRNHVSSNKNDPWSQKHTIRHQNHLSIWNRTKVTKSRFWRPSWILRMTELSNCMYLHTNVILDPQNIYLDTKHIILCNIEPKLEISIFEHILGGHLGF